MKILLIQPNYRGIYQYAGNKGITPIFPPFGLAYIAAVLREKNIPVKILEANAFDLSYEQIKKEIEKENPDHVGITATTCLIEEANKIAKLCPENVKVIVGGIHASSLPKETLEEFKDIDIVVCGEGEYTLLEIAKGKPFSKIKGISYRKGNKIITNPKRPLIEDLNSLPLPARDMLPMKKYFSAGAKREPSDYLLSSRGCPYNCTFCSDFIIHGKKFRYRSPENIIKEIKYLVSRGVKDIDIIDDNFTLLIDRAEKICDLLIKEKLNKKISWRCSNGVRIDRLTPSLLKKMKQAGCYMLSLGIESGNEQILKNIKKGITREQVRKAVKWCKDAKIETRGLFMLGNLGETEKTMQDTINFAKELDLDTAVFHITIPFPETEYWKIIKKEGKIFPERWRDYMAYGKVIFTYKALTPELLLKMQKRAYKQYYLRPKMFIKKLFQVTSLKKLKTTIKGGFAAVKISTGK